MKAILRSIGAYSGEPEESTFNPKYCSVRLFVDIGPDNEEAVNCFNLHVVTPSFLDSSSGAIWGKSMLIVQTFDWDEVERLIEELLSGIVTETWEDAVRILKRYMDWEYEGM